MHCGRVAFDTAAQAYLESHPKASVVALAEGLQTSLWRLDSAGVADELTWYSVDFPPVMALREKLLPHDDRIVPLAQSALDRSWMDRVDNTEGVFITAEGLLMYLEPDDALRRCRSRVPRRGRRPGRSHSRRPGRSRRRPGAGTGTVEADVLAAAGSPRLPSAQPSELHAAGVRLALSRFPNRLAESRPTLGP